jgi:hypothetical protein
VGQSSPQHDKCQVGNMHTYSLDLVHFPIHFIIIQSIIQLSYVPSCTCIHTCTYTYTCICSYTYTHTCTRVSMPGYLGRWTEEVGYQACGILKIRVFMPVSNSLEVRELLGIDFLKVPNCSYRALRLPVRPIVEAPKGKWGNQRTFE